MNIIKYIFYCISTKFVRPLIFEYSYEVSTIKLKKTDYGAMLKPERVDATIYVNQMQARPKKEMYVNCAVISAITWLYHLPTWLHINT